MQRNINRKLIRKHWFIDFSMSLDKQYIQNGWVEFWAAFAGGIKSVNFVVYVFYDATKFYVIEFIRVLKRLWKDSLKFAPRWTFCERLNRFYKKNLVCSNKYIKSESKINNVFLGFVCNAIYVWRKRSFIALKRQINIAVSSFLFERRTEHREVGKLGLRVLTTP